MSFPSVVPSVIDADDDFERCKNKKNGCENQGDNNGYCEECNAERKAQRKAKKALKVVAPVAPAYPVGPVAPAYPAYLPRTDIKPIKWVSMYDDGFNAMIEEADSVIGRWGGPVSTVNKHLELLEIEKKYKALMEKEEAKKAKAKATREAKKSK